jgi:nucleotide-binding universal stress UspA family protein
MREPFYRAGRARELGDTGVDGSDDCRPKRKAAQAIVQAGERFVVDAIVVGSHGKGRALRSLLGSVSRDVVHQARRPVLVVPSPDAAQSNDVQG